MADPIFNEGFVQGKFIRKQELSTKNGKEFSRIYVWVKKPWTKEGENDHEEQIFDLFGKSRDAADPLIKGALINVIFTISSRMSNCGTFLNHGLFVKRLDILSNGAAVSAPPAYKPAVTPADDFDPFED